MKMFWSFKKSAYLCNVFFMVLDLRLTKIDCRETINLFVYTYTIINLNSSLASS